MSRKPNCWKCGVLKTPENTSTQGKIMPFRAFCRSCRNQCRKALGGKEPSYRRIAEVVTLDSWQRDPALGVESLIKQPKPLPPETKSIYLDIETSGISKSEYSYLISYSLLEKDSDRVIYDQISLEDIQADSDLSDIIIRTDEKLLKRMMEALKPYNRIVTWFGKGFDVKMLRTRCLMLGIPFPETWMFVHEDLYYTARNKCHFTSNRLGNVAKHLGCKSKRTDVTGKAWILAGRGHEGALAYVKEHNIIDVEMLKFVDAKLQGHHVENRSKL